MTYYREGAPYVTGSRKRHVSCSFLIGGVKKQEQSVKVLFVSDIQTIKKQKRITLGASGYIYLTPANQKKLERGEQFINYPKGLKDVVALEARGYVFPASLRVSFT